MKYLFHLVNRTKRIVGSPVVAGGLKVVITIVCLWYVSRKIDWLLTWELLATSNKWWLVFATLLFSFSKIVSSLRLNIYFKNIAVYLSQRSNLKLYWVGMFYNLFLPGGIGGDAYKILLLNRKEKHSVKMLTAAVLLDRISGVAGLGILVSIFYFLIFRGALYSGWLLLAVLPALAIYYVFVKKVFPSFVNSVASTLVLGIIVQFLQVLCVYCIMASINIKEQHNQFILLFLLSSIVAIFPFTIGGLGAREIVFLWGSNQFALDTHQSIYVSVLFYLITVAVSFAGIKWVYKSPLREASFSPKIELEQ